MSIMEVACFNFLKTKLKLGYAVYTQVHTDDDVTGISITVQSLFHSRPQFDNQGIFVLEIPLLP